MAYNLVEWLKSKAWTQKNMPNILKMLENYS